MKLEKILAIATFIMIVTVAVWAALRPDLIPRFNLVLLAGLIAVTTVYAYSTIKIARHSEKQAEEMREQRVMASRPVIIQKAILKPTSLTTTSNYFEIYNAGNGPAIGLEILLLDKGKRLLEKQRETFLRTDEAPIEFEPANLASHEDSTCYLLCQYQSILSCDTNRIWYQTWLPFVPAKSQRGDNIIIRPQELEFREVTEKESF